MIMENLKQHVPSLYFELIACHCLVKGIASRCAFDLVVACTTSGALIEFSKKQVLKTCEIKNCVPESVEFFVRYKPFHVFYIVKSATNVYVVSREESLKVSHEFKEVEKVVKDDFWKVGSPQIGFWYCNQKSSERPHFITDLTSSEDEQSPLSDEFTVLYNQRLKEFRMKCVQLKQNLEEKRKLRYNCTQQLLKSELEEDLCGQLADDLHLVTVFGERPTNKSTKSQGSVSLRLEMRRVWQKIHNEKWIVGVQVVNKGKIPVVNLKLLLKFKDGQSVTSKTYFYRIKNFPDEVSEDESYRSLVTQWESSETLSTNVLATAVGVLKIPTAQLDKKLILCGVITYNLKNETPHRVYQLPIPDVEISIEDIVRDSLSIFQNIPAVCEEDLLSILVTTQCFQLVASKPVAEILKEKFKFSSLSDYGRYYSGGNGFHYFSGVFVESWHEIGREYHLTIYARDSSQALSVVHCLYSALAHGAYIVPVVNKKPPDLQKMYSALEAEIKLTAEQLSEWEEKFDIVDGNIYVPRKEYFQFRSSAFNLEKETDELDV